MTGVGVGTWYYLDSPGRAAQHAAIQTKEEKAQVYKREQELHSLALVSYVFPTQNGRRTSSVPVMIKLSVAGSEGLKAVCSRMPHVKEAVLRTLTPRGGTSGGEGGRLDLASFEPSLRRAINEAAQVRAVQSLNAVMMNNGAGGTGVLATEQKCDAALKR